MILGLGIIIGVLISLIVLLVSLRYKSSIERGIDYLERTTKAPPSGEVFIQNDTEKELEKFVGELPTE